MCGIVGYIGDKEKKEVILSGLKELEYRGYDSAGMAVMSDDKIDEIFLYDWDRYKEQRNHCLHNRHIAENEEFESSGIEDEIYLRADNWHQAIENVNLYSAIMSLNDEQRLIIWLYAFEGLRSRRLENSLVFLVLLFKKELMQSEKE